MASDKIPVLVNISADQVIELLKERGTLVEVVRCRECKHHEDEEPGMVYCPKIVGSWVSENWFCADGEREVQE